MNRSQLELELQSRLQIATNSNRFPSTRLTDLIKSGNRRATSMFFWPELSRAKTTDTVTKDSGEDDTYYDYPDEFRTGSIFRVEIDGKEYNRKNFESFRDYRNRFTNPSNRIFSNYQRFLFISPDTSAGSQNMDIWGIINAPELSNSGDETIFSDQNEEGNLAIVRLALATALLRIDSKLSKSEEDTALTTLVTLNKNSWDQYQRDQLIDTPMYNVPDYFGKPNLNSDIGRFSYDPQEHY